MWALLDDNDQLVAGEPLAFYNKPVGFLLNDVQYPRDWWTKTTTAEKNALHIWPLTDASYDASRYKPDGSDPTFSFDGSTITRTHALTDIVLDRYKANKIKSFLADRSTAASADITETVNSTEYTFAADDFSRDLAGRSVTALSAGLVFPVDYKWATVDNQVLTLTEAQLKQLAKLMLVQEYNAQKQYWELKKQVEDAVDHAAVDLIVWT